MTVRAAVMRDVAVRSSKKLQANLESAEMKASTLKPGPGVSTKARAGCSSNWRTGEGEPAIRLRQESRERITHPLTQCARHGVGRRRLASVWNSDLRSTLLLAQCKSKNRRGAQSLSVRLWSDRGEVDSIPPLTSSAARERRRSPSSPDRDSCPYLRTSALVSWPCRH